MQECKVEITSTLNEKFQICAGHPLKTNGSTLYLFFFSSNSSHLYRFFVHHLIISDACEGDSGGPLMQVANSVSGPRYYLVGLVSYGTLKCGDGIGVYTKLTAYMPTILELLG